MPNYLTVLDVAAIFRNTERTIRRWIEEDRRIEFDGLLYTPKKDPGGNWLFVVTKVVGGDPEDAIRKPVGPRPRRRVLSEGVE